MLTPIDQSNQSIALDLLVEGFPERGCLFWTQALTRIADMHQKLAPGEPIGRLLFDGSKAAGVILTPVSLRRRPSGETERIVNVSSWYMPPEFRWRGLAMLRSVLADPQAIYTDLTPTSEVQQLLIAFGFQKIADGIAIYPIPFAAMMPSRGGTVRALSEAPSVTIDPHLAALLKLHQSFGCEAVVLHAEGRCLPLAFKWRRLRRLKAAMLVYCDDNAMFMQHMGSIGRYLGRRGAMALVTDNIATGSRLARRYPTRGIKFARGAKFENRTDFLGSELSLFDW